MKLTKDNVRSRIGECYELQRTVLHQRHIVRKRDWVPQSDMEAFLKNAPASRRWWTWRDEDGDGHLLIVWKEKEDAH